MSEEEVVTQAGDPDPDETEATSLAVDVSGNKMVPLSALIAAKKEGKSYRDKVKELEPIAANITAVQDQLSQAAPYINALVTNPKLKAEAIRIAQGTRTSDERTAQPDADEDPDAAAHAEDMGFYLADGTTPDVARARRVLDRLDQRHGRQTDERLRPLAGMTLGRSAEENVRYVSSLTDDNGVPMVSKESLEETIALLGGPRSPMLANPQVVDLLLNNAIGLDKRKGRTPKPVEEPLYLAHSGGGRGARTDVLDSDLRASFARLGIDEKQGQAAIKRLEDGATARKGIALGVK